MKIKETITLEDVLKFIRINYPGVKEAIIESASRTSSYEDFLQDFHEYYSEKGLGGDDTWLDVEEYLGIVLEF